MSKPTGFALLSPEERKKIASKGGKNAKNRHRWSPAKARRARAKRTTYSNQQGFALVSPKKRRTLGRKGGKAKARNREIS
jgi:hypothetical protein